MPNKTLTALTAEARALLGLQAVAIASNSTTEVAHAARFTNATSEVSHAARFR